MINMKYCRFKNTYEALEECYDTLTQEGGVENVIKTSHTFEIQYLHKLIALCQKIADEYNKTQ